VNTIEQRVLNAIDTDGMLALLCDLVAIPSLDGSPEEVVIQEFLADWMARQGFEIDLWELDFAEIQRHPAASWEVNRTRGLGLVGALGSGRGGRSLIFNGHVDVVPAGDEANWPYPPWCATIVNGNVYGRGALDMKGGVCCGLFAAKAIRDAGVKLNGRLLLQTVMGEEDGGIGTLAALLRGHHADGAVIMEPTQRCVAPAQAGAHNFRLKVPGLSAHGCMREEGICAIERFALLHRALLELERERNDASADPLFARYRTPYPLCIGTVQAGNWASTVAESLIAEGRYGLAVGENLAAARQRFEETVARVADADPWLREHRPVVEWWGGRFDPAFTDPEHPIVSTVVEATAALEGTPARLEGMTYGADMRLLVNEGNIPTVMYGPGDVRKAHRPDEHVPIADLVAVTRTLALTALRFCGYES
jgi:acetylornithine deacetylase